jgi:hypothetical protein
MINVCLSILLALSVGYIMVLRTRHSTLEKLNFMLSEGCDMTIACSVKSATINVCLSILLALSVGYIMVLRRRHSTLEKLYFNQSLRTKNENLKITFVMISGVSMATIAVVCVIHAHNSGGTRDQNISLYED